MNPNPLPRTRIIKMFIRTVYMSRVPNNSTTYTYGITRLCTKKNSVHYSNGIRNILELSVKIQRDDRTQVIF